MTVDGSVDGRCDDVCRYGWVKGCCGGVWWRYVWREGREMRMRECGGRTLFARSFDPFEDIFFFLAVAVTKRWLVPGVDGSKPAAA